MSAPPTAPHPPLRRPAVQFVAGGHPTPPGVRPIGPVLVVADTHTAQPVPDRAVHNCQIQPATPAVSSFWGDRPPQSLQPAPAPDVPTVAPAPLATPRPTPIHPQTLTPPPAWPPAANRSGPPRFRAITEPFEPNRSFEARALDEWGPPVDVAALLDNPANLPDWARPDYQPELVRASKLTFPSLDGFRRVRSAATTTALAAAFTMGGLTIGNQAGAWQAAPDGTNLAWGQPTPIELLEPGDRVLVDGDRTIYEAITHHDTIELLSPAGQIRDHHGKQLFRLEEEIPLLGLLLSRTAARCVVAVSAAAVAVWLGRHLTR